MLSSAAAYDQYLHFTSPAVIAGANLLATNRPLSRAVSGTRLQDIRAVGNSRIAHTDVLSVSWQGVPDTSRDRVRGREQVRSRDRVSIVNAGNGECR